MNKIIIPIVILFYQSVFSQTQDWKKDDRAFVFDECMTATVMYKNITQEQQESLCLCYLEKITDEYSKSEYSSKIDIELKRLQTSAINLCANNVGVSLEKEKKSDKNIKDESIIPSGKSAFIGTWEFEEGKFTFYDDGEYKFENIGAGKCRGKWFLNDNILSVIATFCSNEEFEVVKIESDTILMYRKRGKRLYHLKRVN